MLLHITNFDANEIVYFDLKETKAGDFVIGVMHCGF
jgi:hypothetical protein